MADPPSWGRALWSAGSRFASECSLAWRWLCRCLAGPRAAGAPRRRPAATAADFDWERPSKRSRPKRRLRSFPRWRSPTTAGPSRCGARKGGCKERLWASYRSRGGNFGPSGAPSRSLHALPCDNASRRPRSAAISGLRMNRSGAAVVVYLKTGSNGRAHLDVPTTRAPARTASSDPPRSRPWTVGSSWFEPEVALDAAGNATVLYHGQPHPFNTLAADRQSIYHSRSRPRRLLQLVGVRPSCSPPGERRRVRAPTSTRPRARSPRMRPATCWPAVAQQEREDGAPQPNRQVMLGRVQVRERGDMAAEQAAMTGSPATPASTTRRSGRTGHVVLSARARLARGQGRSWRRIEMRSPSRLSDLNDGLDPGRPSFGVDAKGNALGVWAQGGSLDGRPSPPRARLRSSRLRRGARRHPPPPAPTRISRSVAATPPSPRSRRSAGPRRAACVPLTRPRTTTRSCGPRSVKPAPRRSSTLPPPCPRPGDLELDEADQGLRGTGPKVAFNAEGEGVAVWARTGPQGDQIVEAAQVIPRVRRLRHAFPAPAAPASARRRSRPRSSWPARSNGATRWCSTAKVDGPVTALQWSFGTRDEPQDRGDRRRQRPGAPQHPVAPSRTANSPPR